MNFQKDRIAIAVSKGRVAKAMLPLLKDAGIDPIDNFESSRKLVFQTQTPEVALIIVRSIDVPTYVRMGGADLGIVGKDILLELDSDNYYELADLGISRCELVVAESESSEKDNIERKKRVATKYVNTTRRHFAAKGEYVDVLQLDGSMELAPICGMADRIVDLSQTGETLRSNGLKKVETITQISARLIANKASLRLKEKALKSIVTALRQAAGEQ